MCQEKRANAIKSSRQMYSFPSHCLARQRTLFRIIDYSAGSMSPPPGVKFRPAFPFAPPLEIRPVFGYTPFSSRHLLEML